MARRWSSAGPSGKHSLAVRKTASSAEPPHAAVPRPAALDAPDSHLTASDPRQPAGIGGRQIVLPFGLTQNLEVNLAVAHARDESRPLLAIEDVRLLGDILGITDSDHSTGQVGNLY